MTPEDRRSAHALGYRYWHDDMDVRIMANMPLTWWAGIALIGLVVMGGIIVLSREMGAYWWVPGAVIATVYGIAYLLRRRYRQRHNVERVGSV